MSTIRINQEDIYDYIKIGLFKDIEELLDWVNNIIKDGNRVSFYSSCIIPTGNPIVSFDKSADFLQWKTEFIENRKKTIEFIKNYKKIK